ncbi:MAG: serine hydrolase [Planctomycetes bacterium]|nr:serine hydrolase [Planctomycetota bacterium]
MSGRSDNESSGIPQYRDFISARLIEHLAPHMKPVEGVPDLRQVGTTGGLENPQSLQFLCELYEQVRGELGAVLRQRGIDRDFIDQRTRACFELNRRLGIDFRDSDYHTLLGQEDGQGRIVAGPRNNLYCRAGGGAAIAEIPEFLRGHHVTLFGPPDDAKLSINAMNAFHRRLEGEPAIVEELLRSFTGSAKWGADDEDSKTPLRRDLVRAGENLTGCLKGSISYKDDRTGKNYALEPEHRSLPIKRFPGLALPCPFLFHNGNPLPLHLYDFALHLFANWSDPKALVFYVPKLENEEEAAYIRHMLEQAERLIQRRHPEYKPGTIRLMIVLENPRAVFRVNEIMDALHPYFAGASLGWHDYLASTARLMKEDANYRIPVKADPNIVIKHIKASHDLLAEVVGSRGGIKVGGMYGVLPSDNDLTSDSFQVAIRGFIKDVVTQMKRNLSGFWVAHPDFVRLGLALVEAWTKSTPADLSPIDSLVKSLLLPKHHEEMLKFIHGPDVLGLDPEDPLYPRALLVAEMKASDFVANNDPGEIRYNIFQSLQYVTDWLCGNGCVALPATIDGVPVRVMDDLATAERSRWEVWHELHHGRFALEDFVRIAHEEMRFIRKDLSDSRKIVQVKWNERTQKWYPVAMNLMLLLMSAETPVEFATELLLPFTLDSIRDQDDPWHAAAGIDPEKYALSEFVARCHAFFSMCGCGAFATAMARHPVTDLREAERLIMGFDQAQINEAAGFHGDIGEGRATLDATAAKEQAGVSAGDANILEQLRLLGRQYREKFKFKFLISAAGKSGAELLAALQGRLDNSAEKELHNAREALWQITRKRLLAQPIDDAHHQIQEALKSHEVRGAAICLISPSGHLQALECGERSAGEPVTPHTLFEIASLSKSVAASFAIEHFRKAGIPLTTPVNPLLAQTKSRFRIRSLDPRHLERGDQVTLAHLMNHQALNLHYVNGIPANQPMPALTDLLSGNEKFGYEPVGAVHEPGSKFQYSGGGFLVLEHLIQSREGKSIPSITDPFLAELGMVGATFEQTTLPMREYATGYTDEGRAIEGARKMFPAFAAGAMATVSDVGKFLQALTLAFHDLRGAGPISHDTAVQMLFGSDKGSREFMGCDMGLGIFTAEAGPNRLCIHQGANDGFRALFIHCFAGPDRGKGFVIACNGEHNGVLFISEAAQILLRQFNLHGVDVERFKSDVAVDHLPQAERVNAGYRELIFSAFQPDLPEAIEEHGPRDPLAECNLAVGASVIEASNQRFARAENLLSPFQPAFDPQLFGRQGKIMDSWESVRHNRSECDWMIFEMKSPAAIDCAAVSTQFHQGNHAQAIRIEGWDAVVQQWREIVPRTPLSGHTFHAMDASSKGFPFQRIRVSIFPDGGVTRLALYGSNLPADERKKVFARSQQAYPAFDAQTRKPLTPKYVAADARIQKNLERHAPGEMDLACSAFGGRIISATNEHYGPAAQVISPYPPLNMFDGLESARSREPGHSEEIVIELGRAAVVGRVEVDFAYFVNNNPLELAVHGLCGGEWVELVARTGVKAYAGNAVRFEVATAGLCRQIRVTAYPDGGMNRVRVFAAKGLECADRGAAGALRSAP